MTTHDVRHYLTEDGRDYVEEWLTSLEDPMTRSRIEIRIQRVARGLFGDTRYLQDGVHELKLDFGPGYRVYYGRDGKRIVMLLCGGDKSTQKKDIRNAIEYWKDYEARGD
jgi:putative addiction module killer protein